MSTSTSTAFVRDATTHPADLFIKAFSDNQSPADADAPNADIAAVPGHTAENADPTPGRDVDANRAIEEGHATIQSKGQEMMSAAGSAMPDANKGIEEGYAKAQSTFDGGAAPATSTAGAYI